ncbi:MAG: hypothetical protein J6M60_04750 [Clostridia bacterium]|nr:hypothetical protein [Clostridia bacterium]
MKQNKNLKTVLMVLIIALISIVSFGGIYVENKGVMENIVPEYLLARDLKGYRRVELLVNESSDNDVVAENGNVTTDQNIVNEETTNKNENLNVDNYKLVKSIIEKRLSGMNANDYVVRLNEENGNIILELTENSDVDRVVGNVYQQGKFEIVDNDTNEVLMTNSDIKEVKSGYGTTSSGTNAILINIEFNKEGTEKFKEITEKYKESEVETTDENGNTAKEKVTKEVALKIDGTSVLTTHFDTQITNGIMQLTMAIASNATTEEVQNQLLEANNLSSLLNSGNLPIEYKVNQNKFIKSHIESNIINITIIFMVVIAIVGMIYFVIKYKSKGLLAGISLIGFIATFLFVIRYANVAISIGGLGVMLFSVMINFAIIYNMLKKENVMDAIKESAIALVAGLIISVVFTLSNLTIGAILFWTIIITLIYNLVITKTIIK